MLNAYRFRALSHALNNYLINCRTYSLVRFLNHVSMALSLSPRTTVLQHLATIQSKFSANAEAKNCYVSHVMKPAEECPGFCVPTASLQKGSVCELRLLRSWLEQTSPMVNIPVGGSMLNPRTEVTLYQPSQRENPVLKSLKMLVFFTWKIL